MPISEVPPELVEAYKHTRYLVHTKDGPVALRIGHTSAEIADLIQDADAVGCAFITAENPFSKSATADENRVRQERLRQDLVGFGAVVLNGEGQGADPAWPPEASYAAIGISRDEARALGMKYQQNAIVWVDGTGTAELVLLR